MTTETFEYSKGKVATRADTKKRRERVEILISLLFILAIVGGWAFQQVTGTSILNVFWAQSSVVRSAWVLVPMIVLAGVWLSGIELQNDDSPNKR